MELVERGQIVYLSGVAHDAEYRIWISYFTEVKVLVFILHAFRGRYLVRQVLLYKYGNFNLSPSCFILLDRTIGVVKCVCCCPSFFNPDINLPFQHTHIRMQLKAPWFVRCLTDRLSLTYFTVYSEYN